MMALTFKSKGSEPSISPEYQGPVTLLGGEDFIRVSLHSGLDVHSVLTRGLPRSALNHLITNTGVLRNQDFLRKAIGLSTRTSQRHRSAPDAPLSEEQSGRAWKFAEILSKATEVFGTQEAAEQWLTEPALALNQNRPIDLLSTQTGTEQVQNLLVQLEYCVYV
jgi:putative toxin-antitoxin system antitoxin component (TIGR02293 family)